MKRGKFVSFVRKICVFAVLFVGVFGAGFYFGFRQNMQDLMSDVKAKAANVNVSSGGYTAILSGKWLYVYDDMGALYDTIYVYTEYLTEEDKAALSSGVDFANEEEMRAFVKGFE